MPFFAKHPNTHEPSLLVRLIADSKFRGSMAHFQLICSIDSGKIQMDRCHYSSKYYDIQKSSTFPSTITTLWQLKYWKVSAIQIGVSAVDKSDKNIIRFHNDDANQNVFIYFSVQPDLENNRELAPWRSLELIDTLLCLAESGHTHTVKEIFSFPQQNCPDVLTLGLMQINPPMTTFRTEILVHLHLKSRLELQSYSESII